ncbi:hypothetical protein [Hymenobacter cavernae]|uniref:DUF4840 domain-containing protein n=1 Tax=Hymenobacter cavernae TaxID=2044852 RepID=A0ABQ1U0Q7_9BACT|nr:hypothetical protein [Hymenobacter cavernae]GGF07644.1 hypothetical protein GCM10011383_18450 [Hymenobacter cavernae]
MRFFALLSIAAIITSCTPSTDDKIKNFWTWFVNNKESFEHLNESSRDEKLDLIIEHLQPITDGLAVEVSSEIKKTRALVISPEGDKTKFSVVRRIVDAAPLMQGWKVTAFRQRDTSDFILEYRSLKFTPSEMYFHPLVEGDSLDLIIYSKGIKNHNPDTVALYGLITLDNVLGEYDCVMEVRDYDFQDLDDEKDKSDLRPLKELPRFVDNFHRTNK